MRIKMEKLNYLQYSQKVTDLFLDLNFDIPKSFINRMHTYGVTFAQIELALQLTAERQVQMPLQYVMGCLKKWMTDPAKWETDFHRATGMHSTPKPPGTVAARNAGQPWTAQDDTELRRLTTQRTPIPAMATAFRRTPAAIRARILKNGLAAENDPLYPPWPAPIPESDIPDRADGTRRPVLRIIGS